MAKTYQAKYFTGQQLDGFMGKVLDHSLAGQGLQMDQEGTMHVLAPGYGRLLYSYTHTSNYEVHPEGVNLVTGEFVATAHGLTSGWQVYVVVNAPHHLLRPYNYLPGGLRIGPDNGTGSNGQAYYVNVVDENTFTLSKTSGGAADTFTEVSTMDLTKFHFERYVAKDFVFDNLPPSRELLVVIKGRMPKSYRYLQTNNTSRMIGDKSFDSDTYSDGFGSTRLGSVGGWGSLYARIEIKYIGEKHMIAISEQETTAFKPDNTPVPGHVRKFIQYYTVDDFINTIRMRTDGMLANGSTLEVYAK